jgi:hypothetical protein
MVDLPAPIMPTSTTERFPRAATIAASWDTLAITGKTVSDIKNTCNINGRQRINELCRIPVTYTTPCASVASTSCSLYPDMVTATGRPNRPISPPSSLAMPSLFRFLTVVAVIVGVVYGVIFALANFVNPKPREMTVTIQPDKFLKK